MCHKENGVSWMLYRTGLSQVIPLDSLKCFYPDEVEAVLCGQGETWTTELLLEAIKFDHG